MTLLFFYQFYKTLKHNFQCYLGPMNIMPGLLGHFLRSLFTGFPVGGKVKSFPQTSG